MKQMKRKPNLYKTTNLVFDSNTVEARSYAWWTFVSKVEGKIVFNNFRYSVTTGKHQAKVSSLMETLGIKADMTLPLPEGNQCYSTLQEMIDASEEHLCKVFLEEQLKKQDRYERSKYRKLEKVLTDYLENDVHFRDYEIKDRRQFGHINTIAVHQVVDKATLAHDVENALNSFHRDGFNSVVFYV